MSIMWWGVIGTSLAAFALKYAGHSIPQKYLFHSTFQSVNALIPIALLSALVAVQTFTDKSKVAIDHRAIGLGMAVICLKFRAPFPVVVLIAALSSALVYHLH